MFLHLKNIKLSLILLSAPILYNNLLILELNLTAMLLFDFSDNLLDLRMLQILKLSLALPITLRAFLIKCHLTYMAQYRRASLRFALLDMQWELLTVYAGEEVFK